MDADFAKEHPYIYLSVDGENMIFQITALFITDIGFDYIAPDPMANKQNLYHLGFSSIILVFRYFFVVF